MAKVQTVNGSIRAAPSSELRKTLLYIFVLYVMWDTISHIRTKQWVKLQFLQQNFCISRSKACS
jgi:hypothetical protein